MSKPLSHNALDLLLEKVRDTYAFKIVHSKDCDNLAYAISDQCGETISGSTVKRLFGFIKTQSSPNKFTLNLLARYVGNEDFDSFVVRYSPQQVQSKNDTVTSFLAVNSVFKNGLCEYETGWARIKSFLESDLQATTNCNLQALLRMP